MWLFDRINLFETVGKMAIMYLRNFDVFVELKISVTLAYFIYLPKFEALVSTIRLFFVTKMYEFDNQFTQSCASPRRLYI